MLESTKNEPSKRIDSLDYLRGIAAISVMLYHYYSWTISDISRTGFASKVGLYAVSIFYVLSGLTLYKVYISNHEFNTSSLKIFFTKRLFRIYPLLWLVLILTIAISVTSPSAKTIFLNFTGLFGILDCAGYYGTGVWSIGNELAFYSLFPLFWFMVYRKKFLPLLFITFLIYLWFAFIRLTGSEKGMMWDVYVNPLNQVFLFVAGMAIARYMQALINYSKAMILLGVLSACFVFYPAIGKDLITGIDRVVLGIIVIGICFCFFQLPKIENVVIHPFLKWMGDASYSIYLIHPIIFTFVFTPRNVSALPVKVLFPLAILGTFIVSGFSYWFYEKKFVRIGNKLSKAIPQ